MLSEGSLTLKAFGEYGYEGAKGNLTAAGGRKIVWGMVMGGKWMLGAEEMERWE